MRLLTYMRDNADRLLFLTEQHIELVLISVAISVVIGIGLALATHATPRLRHGLLSLTGTLLTVPSFALFALMIPVFGLGATPTILTLAIYGVFPILRNTITVKPGRFTAGTSKVTPRYRWLANGVVIKHATEPTFKIRAAQRDTKIRVRIIARVTVDTGASKTSTRTKRVTE